MTSTAFELLAVENFAKNLGKFPSRDKDHIKGKIEEMLAQDPYRYGMLSGGIPISGLNIYGLHRMKVGVRGLKGGAYVLYRICEECKKNNYMGRSGAPCQFCDDEKNHHVVLFDVNPRSVDYNR